ncbi:hypothetical protein [Psychrobacter sp. FDAARGOS_221]|uniref:hypothetical protein n=1 Tax=Psychrobacter sp. FDAARGOS_221 TaxID=1975705 RepID=UPI000BB52B8B|nr:hypothetical protein [Psychrobacter sp. FDAARGOS_221]PNK61484.1 hypothetical protein A6J60_011820 [Psychrobacter sp. FDAARGOS_221]
MAKTMSALIADVKAAESRLIKHVQPLNKRLNALNMHVYWDGSFKEWFINRFAADDRGGISFWLDERKFKKLMAMNNTELREYCENWG